MSITSRPALKIMPLLKNEWVPVEHLPAAIPLFDRRDHPSVPTCLPRGKTALGGQGWPQATAERREASLRAGRRLAMLGADRDSGEV
jgi:hypothetical protein